MVSKSNVILIVFLLLGIAYLFWLAMKTKNCKVQEHFTDVSAGNYESRMNVIKVFDTVLHRKPTQDEIEQYYIIENEQDLLMTVLADFGVKDEASTEEFKDTLTIPVTATPPTTSVPPPTTSALPSTLAQPTTEVTVPAKMITLPQKDVLDTLNELKLVVGKIEKMFA